MEKKKKKSYISIFFTTILIYVISLIVFLPPFRKGGGRSHQKACYSNLRVIQGALEMYNMDHEEMMTDLDMRILIDAKYLKEEPRKPEKECRYYSQGNLTEDGEICCDFHGGLIAEANSDIAIKIKREKKLKEMNDNLLYYSLRALPAVIYLMFALM